MLPSQFSSIVLAAAAIAAAAACIASDARTDHACDPIGDAGWTIVPTHEPTGAVDSAPYQAAASGNWFLDRTTTVLPLCNYFNAVGNYSLRSYSLAPSVKVERIGICQPAAASGSVAVPPYGGPCPPR